MDQLLVPPAIRLSSDAIAGLQCYKHHTPSSHSPMKACEDTIAEVFYQYALKKREIVVASSIPRIMPHSA